MKVIVKVSYIVFGTLFIILGLIGLLLPVVPTTPFLVVAGLFYIKSSEKLYNYLINTKYFGTHIKNYVEYRRVEHRFKISSILLVWFPTMITVIFIVDNIYVRSFSIFFALFVTFHVLSLESIK